MFIAQADFLEDNMGSSNMKGFGMALQKRGKVHHTILVEQVRATSFGIFLQIRMLVIFLSHRSFMSFLSLAFLLRSSWQRGIRVLHPNANWQCCSVWEEVRIIHIEN